MVGTIYLLGWNRLKVADKRWFGRIPTVLLCFDRPGYPLLNSSCINWNPDFNRLSERVFDRKVSLADELYLKEWQSGGGVGGG